MSTFFTSLDPVSSIAYSLLSDRLVPEVVGGDGVVVGWRFTLCVDCELIARDYVLSLETYIANSGLPCERRDLTQRFFHQLAQTCAAHENIPSHIYSMIHVKDTYYARGYEYNLIQSWRQHTKFPYIYYKKLSV